MPVITEGSAHRGYEEKRKNANEAYHRQTTGIPRGLGRGGEEGAYGGKRKVRSTSESSVFKLENPLYNSLVEPDWTSPWRKERGGPKVRTLKEEGSGDALLRV